MRKKEYVCETDVIHQESVNKVLEVMPNEMEMEQLAKFFRIIGEDTRAKIIFLLTIHELCVCDLAILLKMTKSSISHQLAILRKEDFVKVNKMGKNAFYSVKDEHVSQIAKLAFTHIREGK